VPEKEKFKLGQKVRITGIARPIKPGNKREWTREKADRAGVIAGIQHVKEGKIDWGGIDEPVTFKETKTIKTYLVAVSLRTQVRVFPEDIRTIPEYNFEVGV